MKKFKKFLPVLFALILVLGGGCADTDINTPTVLYGKEFPIKLSEDIEITDAFAYNGEFPEDGSFEVKNEVFALKVTNKSDKDIQLVRIYVVTDRKECLFEITTLPSQKSVTVFEKNAQSVYADEKILEIREENKVFFENKLSVHADEFELTQLDRVFNVKNISSNDISPDVYIYYKRTDANGDYFGGITFRSNAGAFKAGEFKQAPARHFVNGSSEVLLVDYAKP